MTIKQQFNHGAIQTTCHLLNGIFHSIPFHLCNNLLILLCRLPLCHSLKITNYGMGEKKIFCIYGYFSVSTYVKRGRKSHL